MRNITTAFVVIASILTAPVGTATAEATKQAAENPDTALRAELGQAIQHYMSKDYEAMLKVVEGVHAKAQTTPMKLQALHMITDANRRLGNWQHVIQAVDKAYALYPDPTARDAKVALKLSNLHMEKAVAAEALGDHALLAAASDTSYSLYPGLSGGAWQKAEAGAWVASTSGQRCPAIVQEYVRYDAYAAKDRETGCMYWHVSNAGYRVHVGDLETVEASLAASEEEIANFRAVEVPMETLPVAAGAAQEGLRVKSYRTEGRFAMDYVSVAPEAGGWRLWVVFPPAEAARMSADLKRLLEAVRK